MKFLFFRERAEQKKAIAEQIARDRADGGNISPKAANLNEPQAPPSAPDSAWIESDDKLSRD